MTCIVGIAENSKVWLGADALYSNGHTGSFGEPKILKINDDLSVAHSGTGRVNNLLSYDFKLKGNPEQPPGEYLIKTFIPALKECLRRNGELEEVSGKENAEEWFIVACKGKLYQMFNDFSIREAMRGYEASGSGYQFALGSLESTKNIGLSPKQRIKIAIKATTEHCVSVGGKITVVKVK
jgi:ATP-dependent protease HslVU (ClpYQ) peptidase subunit